MVDPFLHYALWNELKTNFNIYYAFSPILLSSDLTTCNSYVYNNYKLLIMQHNYFYLPPTLQYMHYIVASVAGSATIHFVMHNQI